MNTDKISCSKCFVKLEKLKKGNITDYLIKIVNEDGNEKYICTTCLSGW